MSTQFAQFPFAPPVGGAPQQRINDSGDGESAADYRTHHRQEGVERLPSDRILDCNGRQIVSEPNGRNGHSVVRERHLTLVRVSVLIATARASVRLLVNGGHDLHVILVARERYRWPVMVRSVRGLRLTLCIASVGCAQSVETGQLVRHQVVHRVAERQLVHYVTHVHVLRLCLRRVRRHVEVARHFVDEESAEEETSLTAEEISLKRVVNEADLMASVLVLNV